MELNLDLQNEPREDSAVKDDVGVVKEDVDVAKEDVDVTDGDKVEENEMVREDVVSDGPNGEMEEVVVEKASETVTYEPPKTTVSEVTPTGVSGSDSKPKKKSSAVALGMLCMTIAALAGIAFGVWAMMDSESKKDELKSQISSLKTENAELKNNTNMIVDDAEETVDIETGYENVDSTDYIYVGDWGLKIGISDELELVTYSYDHGGAYTVLSVSGATKDGQTVPDFAMLSNCKLGVVERYSNYNVESGIVPSYYGDPFMSDDEYSYYYSGPQALCTSTPDYSQWELDSAEAIKDMLTDRDNYSKI